VEIDNRKFTRRDIDLAVQIQMADGTTVRGALLDLSQGGVRLKVSNPDNLPEQFMLKLSDELHRMSRIAWRSAEEIGVEFLSAPQALADSKAKRSVLIKCPKTGRDISTGILLTSAGDLNKMLSNVRRFTRCPFCKVVHGWMPSDTSLERASSRCCT
jgi:hypothetical protein